METIKRNFCPLSHKNKWHVFVFRIKCNIKELNIAFVKATDMILGNHWMLNFQDNFKIISKLLISPERFNHVTLLKSFLKNLRVELLPNNISRLLFLPSKFSSRGETSHCQPLQPLFSSTMPLQKTKV